MISKHLKYASYVARHKWFVFVECCKLGIPVRGVLHDLSKFRPSEWFPYVEYFYGSHREDSVGGQEVQTQFDLAWLLHQKRNPHHWQFWLLREDSGSSLSTACKALSLDAAQDEIESNGCHGDYYWIRHERVDELREAMKGEGFKVFEMPLPLRKEMLADWMGAGKAQGKKDQPKECASWYMANKYKMTLGAETRLWIEMRLGIYKET
jgi:hypothetical protein